MTAPVSVSPIGPEECIPAARSHHSASAAAAAVAVVARWARAHRAPRPVALGRTRTRAPGRATTGRAHRVNSPSLGYGSGAARTCVRACACAHAGACATAWAPGRARACAPGRAQPWPCAQTLGCTRTPGHTRAHAPGRALPWPCAHTPGCTHTPGGARAHALGRVCPWWCAHTPGRTRTPGRARSRALGYHLASLAALGARPVLGAPHPSLVHNSSSRPPRHPWRWVTRAHSWSHPCHWPRAHPCLGLHLTALAAPDCARCARRSTSPWRAPLESGAQL